MKRMIWATSLVAALCLALAAPVAAADPARPFAGHDRVVDTFSRPTTCPEGATWRYRALVPASSGTSAARLSR